MAILGDIKAMKPTLGKTTANNGNLTVNAIGRSKHRERPGKSDAEGVDISTDEEGGGEGPSPPEEADMQHVINNEITVKLPGGEEARYHCFAIIQMQRLL